MLSEAAQAARGMKLLLVIVALLYVGSYLAGWYLVSVKSPIAVEASLGLQESVLTQQPFTSILQSLQGGELVKAILLTFLVNLTVGAFLTTTLPGIVPLVGSLGTIIVTILRGFVIGIVYPEILSLSFGGFILGFGTLILELGAYIFSGAAGINIALAPIMPKRYGVLSRWAAFRVAWRDALKIYVIVAILLVLGAVWEMTGLFVALR